MAIPWSASPPVLAGLAVSSDKVQHLKSGALERCLNGFTVERVSVRAADDDGLCGLGELCRLLTDTSDKSALDEHIIIS